MLWKHELLNLACSHRMLYCCQGTGWREHSKEECSQDEDGPGRPPTVVPSFVHRLFRTSCTVQANFSLKDDRDCVNPFIDHSNDAHVKGYTGKRVLCLQVCLAAEHPTLIDSPGGQAVLSQADQQPEFYVLDHRLSACPTRCGLAVNN